MPLLFGTDKKKLSKRHGATKLEQLTAMGYLVEVVRNYLCFLSTEFDESMITWTLDDLVEKFDVLKLGTSASIFDPQKLRWMNGRFIRQLGDVALGERPEEYLVWVVFYGGRRAVEADPREVLLEPLAQRLVDHDLLGRVAEVVVAAD